MNRVLRGVSLASLTWLPVGTAVAQAPFQTTRHATLPAAIVGYDITAGDVDGDGDTDLVVANDYYVVQLFLNDGRGAFVDATTGRLTTPLPTPTQPIANATYAVDLADIDGDGDLDLLLCNDHNLPNRVHTNNGAGVFTDVSATALPANNSWSVDQVVADFDGDGDVDWFVQSAGGGPELYLNNGAGVFTDVSAVSLAGIAASSWAHTGCAAVDLDQDGDLDILAPRSSPVGLPAILINQGNATFTAAPANTTPAQYTGHAFAADLDVDGRVDLVVGGRWLLRNLGGLTFASPVALPSSVTTAFDFDDDGDVDLIQAIGVWRNDGTGSFQFQATPGGTGIYPGKHAIADLDGDGDRELIAPFSILVNFLRQVHTDAAPAIGQSYTVDFHVPTDSPLVVCFPAIALGAANIPVPGFGTLRLDPTTAQTLPTMFVSGGLGIHQVTSTIPNDPGFVGLELHHQALIADPLRPAVIGNAVRDTIQ